MIAPPATPDERPRNDSAPHTVWLPVLLLKPILVLIVRTLGPGRLRLAVLKLGHGLNAF
jgi:hypothetical protein